LLPTPHFDPGDTGSLRDLGRALKGLLAAAESTPTVDSLFKGRNTLCAELTNAGVAPEFVREMTAYGLATDDGEQVRIPFQIRMVEDSIIVTDRPISNWRAEAHYIDPLWGGPTLYKLLIREPARHVLDLGCGCGVMGLVASRFSDRVLGIDINPRAVVVARLNVALNGIENIDIVESDLFTAARGQTFDRILFNSPTGFELRPRSELEAGEEILERFFSEVLGHLDQDGYVQLEVGFMDRRDSTFWERVQVWLGPGAPPLQLVVLERFRINRGVRFFLQRLLLSLQDRTNGFDVVAISRGWLVMRRGEHVALQVPLDQATLSDQVNTDFGDVLVRSLMESRGHLEADALTPLRIAPRQVLEDCLRRMETISWR
jgi:SAM-dependent methyltransferase